MLANHLDFDPTLRNKLAFNVKEAESQLILNL